MRNGWTEPQYSICRAIFGGYLFVHYASLFAWGPELFSRHGVLPNPWASPLAILFPNILTLWDSDLAVRLVILAAVASSVMLAAGLWDRGAAIILWYLGTCLFDRNPLIRNPALPYVGWLLLAHACMPPLHRGFRSARRLEADTIKWRMPAGIYAVAWLLLAAGYSYSGLSKLSSPSWLDGTAVARVLMSPLARPGLLDHFMIHLPSVFLKCSTWSVLAMEISFAPLSLSRRLRPWIWSAMVMLHVSLLTLVRFADLTAGMLMMHLFTFDPSWIPAARAEALEDLFYDGECGLCNWAVRLVISEGAAQTKFRCAPLGGRAFQDLIPAARRAGLPDSVVVITADGEVLTRGAAVVHILGRLGGMWRCFAWLLSIMPRRIVDTAYDFIARNRFRISGRPADVCQLLPIDAENPAARG